MWRIQLNSDGDALIPGMQGGFKIVRGEEIVCSFGDGLAYAATWAEQFGKDIVVTGRFYDMEISAWRIERS